MTIEPDEAVATAAHRAWVEITTRAGAAGFSEDDLIVDVYASWYELFRSLRAIAAESPVAPNASGSDAQLLVDALVEALNEGLRPHLKRRQAAVREWWASAEVRDGESPQERQRRYPDYDAIASEIETVGASLQQVADALWPLIHERKTAERFGWLARESDSNKGNVK